ncbi:MAG: acetylserotonin O-methyltransferase [Chromatiaceae bacterium]|jgi:demethylspheroidene O-methyltransferase|nr:acetylserotonin O-methyltransferase [Chromatiaceae bacterium]
MSPAGRPAPAEVAVLTPSADRRLGLGARWLALRNRLLASPGFQRWASAFPLTRPIARRRARELFDLCAGFVYSQILYACIDARLFERLADGPRRLDHLAADLGLTEAAASRLLKAAASLRLVEPIGQGRYALGELGAALLGNGGISEMVRHHRMLYRDLDDPMALLRGERPQGGLGAYWAYAESARPGDLDQTHTTGYTDLMAASQGLLSGDLLDAYPLRDRRCLLDIGGGNGAFLAAVAARWPHLQLKLFDLPSVAEQARQRFAREAIAPRAQAFGGDLFHDPLPEGADCGSLVRVIHDHDDDPALAILKAARRALPSGGVLLLGEPMSGTPGAEPIGDAYFGFYLLAMGSGRPRTAEELTAMLREAGFDRVREVPTRRPLLTRLLVAYVN